MGVNQRRQLHPLHLFEQQRNVVDALRDDVGYLMHAQSLAQSGIYLQIWANRQLEAIRKPFRTAATRSSSILEVMKLGATAWSKSVQHKMYITDRSYWIPGS